MYIYVCVYACVCKLDTLIQVCNLEEFLVTESGKKSILSFTYLYKN